MCSSRLLEIPPVLGGHVRDEMMSLTEFLAWYYLQFNINKMLIGFHI